MCSQALEGGTERARVSLYVYLRVRVQSVSRNCLKSLQMQLSGWWMGSEILQFHWQNAPASCVKSISVILRCYQGNKAIFSNTHTHTRLNTCMHECGLILPHKHEKRATYWYRMRHCSVILWVKEEARQWSLSSLQTYFDCCFGSVKWADCTTYLFANSWFIITSKWHNDSVVFLLVITPDRVTAILPPISSWSINRPGAIYRHGDAWLRLSVNVLVNGR